MTFPAFPTLPGLEFPVTRAPKASTLVQKAISGRITDQPKWTAPIYGYEVSFSMLRTGQAYEEWQQLEDFWKVVKFGNGRFTYSDPNDNAVAGQAFATGDGATPSFQLLRALSSFQEPVLVPVCGPSVPALTEDDGNFSAAATLFEDDGNFSGAAASWEDDGYFSTMQVFSGAYATNPTTPLAPWSFANGSAQASGGVVDIVPAPAPGTALTWTGAFAWLCRFDQDSESFANFMYRFFGLKKLTFETVRL
jgi:hypothetical protein